MNKKLSELAQLVNGVVNGDAEIVIHGLNDLQRAGDGEITFLTRPKPEKVAATRAAAVIVPLDIEKSDKPLIRVKDPYLAAAVIHNLFQHQPFKAAGISSAAHIGSDCVIPDEVSIGPMCVIGDRVTLGQRATIGPGTIIDADVTIGDDCHMKGNVSIYAGTVIGNRVIIHCGAVIGSDGFGYATDEQGRHVKHPHVGIVRIDDDVEIGANTCIDRGTFGETHIGRGVKIDNLVQLAHNVTVGEGSIIVSQVGVAGSASLGRWVVIGGQSGIKGHIHLADKVMVAGKSGVHDNQEAGAVVSGFPAISHKEWLKASIIFNKLPQLYRELQDMRDKVSKLSGKK